MADSKLFPGRGIEEGSTAEFNAWIAAGGSADPTIQAQQLASGSIVAGSVTPPPPVSTDAGGFSAGLLNQANNLGGNTMANNVAGTQWEVDPRQAYLNQLGIGPIGNTPYQKWQSAQFNPTYATYLAGSQLNPAGAGQVAGNFGDYLSQTGIQGARQTAPNLFNQIGSLAPEMQRDFWDNLGGFANDLLKNILGQRYGAPMASQMGQNFPALQSAFAGGPGYENEQASFLDYLRQKYGL